MACFWVIAAKVNENLNWIRVYEDRNGFSKFKDHELYLASFYFVSTTVTTVGYGDISPQNKIEMVFNILMLFVGVMCFSFASGSLSSMITNFDKS